MNIGLFFGSFNPIHVGHLIIANYMATQTKLDKVWFVISPQSPFKNKKSLANNFDRLFWVQKAAEGNDLLEASNIEFSLPTPSYTVDTLTYLKDKHPQNNFTLIMGGDNLVNFHKWKNHEVILKYHDIFVYKRPQFSLDLSNISTPEKIHFFDAPLMEISASYIRKAIKNNHSIKYLVSDPVLKELENCNAYKL